MSLLAVRCVPPRPVAARTLEDPRAAQRGAVTVELGLIAVPVLLAFVLAALAVGRLYAAQTALDAIARDAARSAVTAPTPAHASQIAAVQGEQAARGYHLDPGRLTLTTDPSGMERGAPLTVTATYHLDLVVARVALTSQHSERIDPYLSR